MLPQSQSALTKLLSGWISSSQHLKCVNPTTTGPFPPEMSSTDALLMNLSRVLGTFTQSNVSMHFQSAITYGLAFINFLIMRLKGLALTNPATCSLHYKHGDKRAT